MHFESIVESVEIHEMTVDLIGDAGEKNGKDRMTS